MSTQDIVGKSLSPKNRYDKEGEISMKRKILAGIGLALCLVMGLCSLPVNELSVMAAQDYTTVQGTVKKGTTASMLLLDTPQGYMEIKIDSNADLSGCRLLLPGKKVYASVYHGSDAYMHAAKITSTASSTSVSIDNSTKATVSGTIKDKSTEEILYVNTPQGEMEIKLDSSTDMSGVSVLVVDRKYSIVCARGSDAYMHAIQITDSGAGAGSGSSSGAASAIPASINTNGATANIKGTVSSNTTPDILYLNTSGGEMQFKLDSSTDTLYGMVHTPGNPLTVYYKYGSDEYWHATCIVGTREASNASINTSSKATVVGTVDKKSTDNILFLSTSGGMMELKMDSVTSISGCKALTVGRAITVTCAYGSDAYMHALTISG